MIPNPQKINFDKIIRAPRYTSYPPANHFNSSVSSYQMEQWLSAIPAGSDLSIYIHIPFCRNICWFCACRTQGINRLQPLISYVDTLKAELDLIASRIDSSSRVTFLHLGGGTPTILPASVMASLLDHLRTRFSLADDLAFAVEIDPTEFDQPRLNSLIEAGLSRVSIGVQDFNPDIQKAIGRLQSSELTARTIDMIRSAGIDSINLDLIYGLPHQSKESFAATLEQITALDPDRLAMFGYAHVPWMARRQMLIDEHSLPSPKKRRELLELGRQHFNANGMMPVGIDHFARPDDKLVIAAKNRRLRRNFQGYTDDQSDILIGVGASAISRLPQGYAQNASGTTTYKDMIAGDKLGTCRGHRIDSNDALHGFVIEQLLCHFGIHTGELGQRFGPAGAALAKDIRANASKLGLVKGETPDWLEIEHDPHVNARITALYFDRYHDTSGSHSLTV